MTFQKGNKLWLKANHKGHAPTMTRSHTEEEKAKTSQTMKEWHRIHQHPMKGKKASEETRQKMSSVRQGKKNTNWKGGLTEIVRGIRRSPEFYQWRKAVLKRDNHTCQDCGITENIDAHHIRAIIDYPEGIFEVENGLALCGDCHKRHSSWQRLKRKRKVKH